MEKRLHFRAPLDEELDDYGIYKCLQSNRQEKIKSYGLLTSTDYIFAIDIYDHYRTDTELKDKVGQGNFCVTVFRYDEDSMQLLIRRLGREEYEASEFELKVMRHLIDEAQRFQNEGYRIEVIIPAEASITEEEEQTEDLDAARESIEAKEEQNNKRKKVS